MSGGVAKTAKKQKVILTELEKLAKKMGLKVSTGKLVYAGLKLRSGQCVLREEQWLVLDRAQPFEDQVELFKRALTDLGVEKELIPEDLKDVFGTEFTVAQS
jgi:hypothetical protein